MDESKVEEITVKALRKAVRYEDKVRISNKELVKDCIKKIWRRKKEGKRKMGNVKKKGVRTNNLESRCK